MYISQRNQELREITARVRNALKSLELLDEQITISEELLKEDLTNRYKHLILLREASTLKGTVEEGQASIERAKLALTQARVNLKRIKNKYDEETKLSLETARRELNELLPRLAKFKDRIHDYKILIIVLWLLEE